jgi:hypothetical protein
MSQNDTSRVSRESLRISSTEPPGWQQPPAGHIPKKGDIVYCTQGPAEVVRVLGRTSDGSRLLELRCADQSEAFFAASSNILVRAADPDGDSPFLQAADSIGS